MELIAIVILLALVEFMGFSMAVGRARIKYEVPAPATSGHPEFERYFRVQQNTLEQLVVFIPALLIYGYFGNTMVAALAGLVFIIGRLLYFRGYVADPKQRGTGFGIGFVAIIFLVVAGLFEAVRAML